MAERNVQQAQQARDDLRRVVGFSVADEIEKLDKLKRGGSISDAEFTRLEASGVAFSREPTRMGPVTIAIFSDTCGNLIQIYQPG